MQAIGQNGRFPFSVSNSGEANSRSFPGQVEYFFFTFGASFLLKIHYQMKTLQLCVKSIYFFLKKVDLLKIKRVLGAAFY